MDSIRKRALERALLSDLDMDNSQADDVPDQLSITWSAEELSPEKRANLSMEMVSTVVHLSRSWTDSLV